jgi:hypothetical protein
MTAFKVWPSQAGQIGAGSLVRADVIVEAAGLIVIYLAVKMVTKFVGILPLTRIFRFERKEGMYTTLMMSTGLTFGSISALFGLTNHIIDERQYTILLTAVIGSAVVSDTDRAALVSARLQAAGHNEPSGRPSHCRRKVGCIPICWWGTAARGVSRTANPSFPRKAGIQGFRSLALGPHARGRRFEGTLDRLRGMTSSLTPSRCST